MEPHKPQPFDNSWAARANRATNLKADRPHADSLLTFYLELIKVQEQIADSIGAAGLVPTDADAASQAVSLTVLVPDRLSDHLAEFVSLISRFAPSVLKEIGDRLSASPGALPELLATYLNRQPLNTIADTFHCAVEPLEFFPRAFVQPLAERLAAPAPLDRQADDRSCPYCARLPQVAIIRDEVELKGRRLLVCSLCSTLWPVTRATCPNCWEVDPDKLFFYESDSLPNVRVEKCDACHTYIKSVDLRKDGKAHPIVDDIASVELDLWCDEQSLRKIQRNVLGL